MYKLKFYSKSIIQQFLVPNLWFRKRLYSIFHKTSDVDMCRSLKRVNYYFKRKDFFELENKDSITLESLSCSSQSAYYYDISSVLRYFPQRFKFGCVLGDIASTPSNPAFVKCRPLSLQNETSAILKLNQVRHFRTLKDPISFDDKVNKLVWRGASYNQMRDSFVKKYIKNPLFDIGITQGKSEFLGDEYQKPFLTFKDQLGYKFIFSIEGNDVATNLKWIAQSNSLCFMVKPKHESWFMEGLLVPNVHYVEIQENLENLPFKIKYYINNPKEAKKIISNLQNHYSQFTNQKEELLVSLLVAVKYFFLSKQLSLRQIGLEWMQGYFLR